MTPPKPGSTRKPPATRNNSPPPPFKDWHHLFQVYHAGLVEHRKIPRGQRGNYAKLFCAQYGIAQWNVSRVYRPYRMAFLEETAFTARARTYFEQFERNEIGSDQLRQFANALYDPHMAQTSNIPAKVQRDAINQIIEYLERIELVLSKIDGDLSADIGDDEVVEWEQRIQRLRGTLTSWFNRRIRHPRARALAERAVRKEGKNLDNGGERDQQPG